jgi:hypothetical protein
MSEFLKLKTVWFSRFCLSLLVVTVGWVSISWLLGAGGPGYVDTDSDGMDDAFEMTWFGNLSQDGGADFDGDTLSNVFEFELGLDPTKADSDGDGKPDWVGIPGYLSREIWHGIPGAALRDLKGSGKFQAAADEEAFVPQAALAKNLANNYGMRIRGRIIAPVDGDFRFILDGSSGPGISGGQGNGDVRRPHRSGNGDVVGECGGRHQPESCDRIPRAVEETAAQERLDPSQGGE